MVNWYYGARRMYNAVTSRNPLSQYGLAAGIGATYLQKKANKMPTKKQAGIKRTRKRRRHALVYGDKKLQRNFVGDTYVIANSFYINNITAAIPQGDGQDHRESDKLILKKVNNTLWWTNKWDQLSGATSGSFHIRCMLFDHDNYVNTSGLWITSANLATSDVFSDTTVPFISPVDYNKVNKVYFDKTYTIHIPSELTTHAHQSRLMKINRNIKKEYTYKTAGGAEGKEGNLYMAVISTSYGATSGTTTMGNLITSRITSFTDL